MKILIADDDPAFLDMLETTLKNLGYQVIAVENGKKAWDICQAEEIHFVISDWEMPDLDGLTLCKRLRRISSGRYCYIVLITGKIENDDLKQAFEAGVDDFIAKPFNREELAVRIKTGERIINLEKEHINLTNILTESRNKLKAVFDSLTAEFVILDDHFIVTSVNKTFITNHSMEFKDTIGASAFDLDINLFNDEARLAIESVFRKGEPKFFLERTKGLDPKEVVKDIHCLPIRDEAGNVTQVAFAALDITEELKQAEAIKILNEELNLAMAQVRTKNQLLEDALSKIKENQAQILQSEKMASIGQLAAGVAHEINNPTGFVSSNIKTLDGYTVDLLGLIYRYKQLSISIKEEDSCFAAVSKQLKEIKEFEEEIDIDYLQNDISELISESREGMERIKKIVMDLKDFAHPEDEQNYANINDCIESTLNIVHNEIKYKATLEKHYGEIPPLLCYPRQLNQVFLNLLVNAAQSISDQGNIYIETQQNENKIRIIIRDTGSGISPENMSKIFNPFFTTKPVGKGTGLGLNLVYNIISKHDGTIQVDSDVGVGTTFTIDLPLLNDTPIDT